MNTKHLTTTLQALKANKDSFKALIDVLFGGFENLTLANTSMLPKELGTAIIYFTNAEWEPHLNKAKHTEHTNLAFSLIPTSHTFKKSELIEATKLINKAIPSYNIIFFLSPRDLSIAFTTRRYAKNTYEKKDVLEKITLIKDISLSHPHIAHIKNLESIANIKQREIDEYYKALLEALSIEKLNDEFFREITGHFLDFCEHITFPSSPSKDSKDTNQSIDSDKREFVLRLISRILFCKFLEKKGLIDSRILDSSISSDYYHNVCEPLFFATLNTPKQSRNYGLLDTRISGLLACVPYLNGGLFAPQDRDFYKLDSSTGISAYINTLQIPDKCFNNLFKTLRNYHFTLDESTPLNQEVGLDPELLGMVFENLLSVLFTDNKQDDKNLRKATGSYYTPREIVSYMCKSALLESLHTKCRDIHYEELKELIFEIESNVQNNIKAKAILPHLQSLKILDPACGSGAFPMGMLHEILSLQDKLDNTPNTSLYERKLNILQNNIYGIDLQPMATEIARLRCFLSLICDAPNENITPLPNLEFKFISANSLIPLPQQQGLQYDGYEKDMQELRALREGTFSAQNKSEIESQYLALRDKIAKNMFLTYGDTNPILEWNPFDPHSVAGFFDSEWMFGIKIDKGGK